jgi:hypothetical protein
MTALRIIYGAHEVSDHMLTLVVNCVEDWFPADRGRINTEDFIDRLCENYGNADGWDIEQLDTPAVRKIMRHARTAQREMA